MRLVPLVVLLLTTPALAQPADAPRQLQLELRLLKQEREEVSVALPVTLTAVGAGALFTGILFDAATASQRRYGEVSAFGFACYVVSSVMLPGITMLLARWVERGMLSAHVRDVELELADAR